MQSLKGGLVGVFQLTLYRFKPKMELSSDWSDDGGPFPPELLGPCGKCTDHETHSINEHGRNGH
jgi:hypothetical protein